METIMHSISQPEHGGKVDTDPSVRPDFMRRRAAANYLKDRYGHGSERTLAKLACLGGGPEFHKAGDRMVLYRPEALDAWALARISAPLKSTSEVAA
jgi:hypothetical protein